VDNKIITIIKELSPQIKEKIFILGKRIKTILAGRKKYVWACVLTLIVMFMVILLSQNSDINNRSGIVKNELVDKKLRNNQPRMVLEINQNKTLENLEQKNNDVTIVESEKLNIDLLEKKLNTKAQEVAKYAEEVQVNVYSNSDGILIKPMAKESDIKQEQHSTQPKETVIQESLSAPLATIDTDKKSSTQTDDEALIEATYEEELPEDEYIEPNELHSIPADKETTQKLKGMDISIKKKPPYFGPNPVIVIVIDDMGISHKRTADISSLQAPITSSFLTYSKDLQKQIQAAQKSGHEIIVHAPMQAKSNLDMAPDVLTIDMNAAEIATNFEKMLDKFPSVRGVNNHMGSKFTEHAEKLAPVMDILRRRGLFFLDSKTSPQSVAQKVAADYAVAYAHRHVFLDNVNQKDYVLKQLALTEKRANKNGYAVAIGHPKSATYQALKEWIPTLDGKNIKLLHLSRVVKVLNPHISYVQ